MKDKLFHPDKNYVERMNNGEDKPHEFANRIIQENQNDNSVVDGVLGQILPKPTPEEIKNERAN